jgi:hypothetical protein
VIVPEYKKLFRDLSERPAVQVGVAASIMGLSRCRVDQLISSGQLSFYSGLGVRFVTLASIASRKPKLKPLRKK